MTRERMRRDIADSLTMLAGVTIGSVFAGPLHFHWWALPVGFCVGPLVRTGLYFHRLEKGAWRS